MTKRTINRTKTRALIIAGEVGRWSTVYALLPVVLALVLAEEFGWWIHGKCQRAAERMSRRAEGIHRRADWWKRPRPRPVIRYECDDDDDD